ncbi:putative membrane protein YesL [Anoxybacillus tepidamans]|uniref:Putative membrane protein YesL n=1 Tax=Anoxybacteroides tepidamans TaxID=265948 RepID=A0A7W8MWV9_9BACL|nr:YesL family protein [Anoxybacillus tepidamans]MBB5326353.1 putative membrane protein YesL [Anoxybacillus tepidamans]
MRSGLLDGKLYRVCEWITKLAYINILWVLFTLVGAVIFGIAPAAVALFTIVRKWLVFHDNDVPVFKTFFQTYKKEFWRANCFGIVFIAVAYILYIDVLYLAHVPSSFRLLFSIVLFIIFIFYIVTLLYIFPIYVHYKLNFWQYMKYALLIGMANPLMTLIMLMSAGVLFVVFMYIPGLIPFFSISLFSLVVMGSALRAFRKVEEKQAIWQQGK